MTSTAISSSPDRRPGSPLTGAILAAGRGSRMGDMDWLAKTLMPVAGRPLLERQLELFDRLGIERTVVVVGAHKEQVVDYLEVTGRLQRGVVPVEQASASGSGDALLCLEGRVDGPFVLFLGDILLAPERDLSPLVAPVLYDGEAATLAVVEETDDAMLSRNFRVDVSDDDRVTGVVEKPAGGAPALKGCGLYAFSPEIFDAARRTARDAAGERGITDCVQTLLDLGRPVRAARVCRWDLNLTRASDLGLAEERLGQWGPVGGFRAPAPVLEEAAHG